MQGHRHTGYLACEIRNKFGMTYKKGLGIPEAFFVFSPFVILIRSE